MCVSSSPAVTLFISSAPLVTVTKIASPEDHHTESLCNDQSSVDDDGDDNELGHTSEGEDHLMVTSFALSLL